MSSNRAIVLIDDNEVDLYLHEQLIRHTGVFSPVWSFRGPAAALDFLASLPYSEPSATYSIVLLVDIKMPSMDGFSFIDRFEKLPLTLRHRCSIVLLSATLMVSDTIRAEAHPSVAFFIEKPLTVSALLEVAEGLA
ncbi:MAG TPA: response regulator [Dinghuibacter sp.]|uniref:response regulator n=1 Tax=Dinghuibacter sp. TaxID=2024697 RepID=UPI002CEEFE34|nr:response regulator [Dinghuibacter sp.]HTJ15062.1 response regulator [Dinghuibacter sp.]